MFLSSIVGAAPPNGMKSDPGGDVRLFGRPAASWEGVPLPLSDRMFEIVGILACEPGHRTSRRQLRDLIWPDLPAEVAAGNLRQTLGRLGKIQASAGARLTRMEPDGRIGLDTAACRIDLLDFLRLTSAATGAAAIRADQLLDLYGGDFLLLPPARGCGPDGWLATTRDHLRQRFLAAIGPLLEDQPWATPDDQAAAAMRFIAVDPDAEAGYRALMQARARRGDTAGIRRAFTDCREALQRDLGAEPSERTCAVFDELCPRTAPAAACAAAGVGADDAARREVPVLPRILVAPPTLLLANEDTARLSGAVIEDVTVKLARYRSFVVIAAPPAAVGGAAIHPDDAAAKARADYCVTSALRPVGGGSVMTFRLTALATDTVVWVFEVAWHTERLIMVFDGLVRSVVEALADAVERATLALPIAGGHAGAYRCYLEGRQCLRSMDLPALRRARRWFRDAIRQSDGYAAPHFGLARTAVLEWFVCGMPKDDSLAQATALADHGLDLDPSDWRGLREKGLAQLYLRRHDECLALFEQAGRLGPSDADLLADHADALAFSGDPQAGLELCRRAIGLNPLRRTYYDWIQGSILFQLRRYDEALAVLATLDGNPAASRILAACAARAGDMALARRHAATVRETYPGFRAADLWDRSPNRHADDTGHLVDALHLAGLK